MQTVNIHEAKTQLSRLVEQAANGEPFVIAKAGKPLVKVMALNTPEVAQQQRLGFMVGQIMVPDNFDQMGSAEIEHIFGGAREISAGYPSITVDGGASWPSIRRGTDFDRDPAIRIVFQRGQCLGGRDQMRTRAR